MRTDYPLVSVVIPATRNDDYLTEAVRSVNSDGYPALEVVVVWDGPAETCPSSLAGVGRIIRTGGIGTPGANNAGLAAATGKFIARLDADDVSLPGRLLAQVESLEAQPSAILSVGNAEVVDSSGVRVGPYPAVPTALAHAFLKANPLVHSTFMFRAGLETRYDPDCIRMQDYDLAMRIAVHSPIAVVEEAIVQYRVHDGQSGRSTTAFWKYIPVVLRTRQQLAQALGVPRTRQLGRDAAWFFAQYLNHLGLRDRYGRLNSSPRARRE